MCVRKAEAVVVVITRVEGVDLGQFFFTCLEELLLKLGIVPLNGILICDCKKIPVVRLVNLEEQSEDYLSHSADQTTLMNLHLHRE